MVNDKERFYALLWNLVLWFGVGCFVLAYALGRPQLFVLAGVAMMLFCAKLLTTSLRGK